MTSHGAHPATPQAAPVVGVAADVPFIGVPPGPTAPRRPRRP